VTQQTVSQRVCRGGVQGVTPVPIPNLRKLSPSWADGTAWVTVWESRSPPGIKSEKPRLETRGQGFFNIGINQIQRIFLLQWCNDCPNLTPCIHDNCSLATAQSRCTRERNPWGAPFPPGFSRWPPLYGFRRHRRKSSEGASRPVACSLTNRWPRHAKPPRTTSKPLEGAEEMKQPLVDSVQTHGQYNNPCWMAGWKRRLLLTLRKPWTNSPGIAALKEPKEVQKCGGWSMGTFRFMG